MTHDFCPTCGRPDGAGHTNEECFGHWWEDALHRWGKYAIDPGDFLRAVLSNDLFGAYGRADDFSKADMDLIVKFIYNKLPGDCWGSTERVSTWKGL
jgi:hypothetical protein